MNFILAQSLFLFTIKTTKALIDYFKPVDKGGTKSEILAERTGKVITALSKIYEDKKIDLSDIPEVVLLLKEASGFIGFDFEAAALQIANATKEELETAFKRFDEEFVLQDKCKEAQLETIFHEIFNIINSVNRIIKVCEKIEK